MGCILSTLFERRKEQVISSLNFKNGGSDRNRDEKDVGVDGVPVYEVRILHPRKVREIQFMEPTTNNSSPRPNNGGRYSLDLGSIAKIDTKYRVRRGSITHTDSPISPKTIKKSLRKSESTTARSHSVTHSRSRLNLVAV